MKDLPTAVLRNKPRFSAVWIVPVFAAVGLVYFFVSHHRKQGREIQIEFSNAGELVADKTVIKYLGVPIGKITDLSVDIESNTVVATARLDRSVEKLARGGTYFTTIKPQVGFGGVEGLTTIFSGVYLALHPGQGNNAATVFKGYPDAEPPLSSQSGVTVVLTASHATSLNMGDPVLFRGVTVGSVEESVISSDGRQVKVTLRIKEQYERFLRDNSVFWQAGGIRAKLGLFNSQVSIDSLQSLLRGGVAFATPNAPGKKINSGHTFTLENSPPKDVESWSPAL